jgi:hypothetical protein
VAKLTFKIQIMHSIEVEWVRGLLLRLAEQVVWLLLLGRVVVLLLRLAELKLVDWLLLSIKVAEQVGCLLRRLGGRAEEIVQVDGCGLLCWLGYPGPSENIELRLLHLGLLARVERVEIELSRLLLLLDSTEVRLADEVHKVDVGVRLNLLRGLVCLELVQDSAVEVVLFFAVIILILFFPKLVPVHSASDLLSDFSCLVRVSRVDNDFKRVDEVLLGIVPVGQLDGEVELVNEFGSFGFELGSELDKCLVHGECFLHVLGF